ncbi:hypothetical protein BDY21DRAFT_277050 [Lineolata rhizophorae]|uniref:Rhomboid-type serine protease n=1 Tax=Lineolata rhizophorae TaxID=578093 RepID=A0A6A6PDL4_9PEZI|nr:hypothetical protein BDY21DRAFT_277050 [Lineolata rhizophorae]
MAANDYYTSFNPGGGTAPSPPRREDAPLPPIPSSTPPYDNGPPANNTTTSNSHAVAISPISSPFDDGAYPAYPPPTGGNGAPLPAQHAPDTAYHGASPVTASPGPGGAYGYGYGYGYGQEGKAGGAGAPTDPFADANAIPLRPQAGGAGAAGGKDDGFGQPGTYPYGVEETAGEDGGRKARRKEKKGWFSGRVTWVVWILTAVQVGVFIGELAKNGILTGTPIAIKPSFNPMIGPSPYVLINMGARFVPCMRTTDKLQNADQEVFWPCPNSTTDNPECTLTQLCGFGDSVPEWEPNQTLESAAEPNQWYRFIVPIFLHAGIVHIGFNMLLQMTLGRDMEKEIGSLRFALVYFSSGIFGFVFGGNYAAPIVPSVGASGSLFGILALVLLDLLYSWSERRSPLKDLLFILLDCLIAFVLGLLPGLDNFSHIGGFLMGLVLGVCLLHSPAALRQRIGAGAGAGPAPAVHNPAPAGYDPKLAGGPLGFFKGRKPLWWAWWLFRAGALVAVLVGFIVLLNNFYASPADRVECGWCKYLSCIPVKNWCELGDINVEEVNQTDSNSRRDVELVTGAAGMLFERAVPALGLAPRL